MQHIRNVNWMEWRHRKRDHTMAQTGVFIKFLQLKKQIDLMNDRILCIIADSKPEGGQERGYVINSRNSNSRIWHCNGNLYCTYFCIHLFYDDSSTEERAEENGIYDGFFGNW